MAHLAQHLEKQVVHRLYCWPRSLQVPLAVGSCPIRAAKLRSNSVHLLRACYSLAVTHRVLALSYRMEA